MYGAVKYQDVFSKSGPFSPAYWANYDELFEFLSETGFQQNVRFYQNAGENEGDQYIAAMYEMDGALVKESSSATKKIDVNDLKPGLGSEPISRHRKNTYCSKKYRLRSCMDCCISV